MEIRPLCDRMVGDEPKRKKPRGHCRNTGCENHEAAEFFVDFVCRGSMTDRAERNPGPYYWIAGLKGLSAL